MLLLRILVIATTLFSSSDAFSTPVSHLQGSCGSGNHYPQYSHGILQSQSSSSSSLIQLRRRHPLISTGTRLSLIINLFSSSSSSGILAAAAVDSAAAANLFQGALSIYKQHLLTEPLKTKVLTGIVLAVVGDALAQYSSSRTTTTTITEDEGGPPRPFEYNVKRAISFATFDGCYRAVQQVTYPPMMKICNGKFSLALLSSTTTVLTLPFPPSSSSSIDSSTQATSYLLHILASFEQTLFSQLLIIPIIYYPTFYIVTSFVQGLSLAQTIHRIKCTFIPLMKRNLLFWIPVQFVTFAFVDEGTNLQIPILIVCGLVWTIILSITAGATATSTTTTTTTAKEECKKEEEELPEDAILSKTNEEYEEAVTTLLIDMPTTYDDGNNNKDEEDLDGGGGRGGGNNTNTTSTPETSTATTTATALRQTKTTTITSLRMKLLSFITFASIMSCNAYAVTTTATTTTRRLWRNNNITTPFTPTTKTGIPRSTTSIVRRLLHPDDDEMSSNTNQVEEEYRQDAVDATLKYNILRISALVATTLLGTHMYLSTSAINLFERYNYLLKYKPLRTKVITGATLAVLGDGIAQLRSSSSGSSRMNARYNPRRALSFATFDGCYRIFQHAAFPYIISSCQGRVVGKIISSSSSTTTTMGGKNIQLACAALERTLVYQLLVIPILYYPIFFTFTGYIQGLTLSQILTRARSSFIPCWKRNLLFWIPCQFIMFSVINERWQIPFACLLGMLWSSILSITAGNANKK